MSLHNVQSIDHPWRLPLPVPTFVKNILKKMFIRRQIRRILDLSVSEILKDPIANKLLRTFIDEENPLLDSEILMFIECYEQCSFLLRNIQLIANSDEIKILLAVCPDTIWFKKINDLTLMIEKGAHSDLFKLIEQEFHKILTELKKNCLNEIEWHYTYFKFGVELRDKSDRIRAILKIIYNEIKNY